MTTWQVKDKQWLQQRKNEWKFIHRSLSTTMLTNKEIKQLEKYFLRGVGEDVDLVFRFWFHPDDSADHWQQMRADVQRSDFMQSCFFFNRNVIKPSYIDQSMIDYGFMGGREQRVYEALFSGISAQGEYKFSNGEKVNAEHVRLSVGGLVSSLRALMFTDEPNKYSPIQYMVEDWYSLISNGLADTGFSEFVKLVLVRKNRSMALAEHLQFDLCEYLKDEFEDYRYEVVMQIYDILENREIPDELNKVWLQYKQQAKTWLDKQ